MKKTILITGSTDGIGLETAKFLTHQDHAVLLHGRNKGKLESARQTLLQINSQASVETYLADLSILSEVKMLAEEIKARHKSLDALINNAGVYVVPKNVSTDGLDIRFVVNTIAPYLLTKRLLPLLGKNSRVVNLSSAAQASIEPVELTKPSSLSDSSVYAKSKLAITMWSRQMADSIGKAGPAIIAVNPASMLGSKMVQQAYGVVGGDLEIGADILVRAAISEEFNDASGKYYDNDISQFTFPHKDALDSKKTTELTTTIESVLKNHE